MRSIGFVMLQVRQMVVVSGLASVAIVALAGVVLPWLRWLQLSDLAT